MITVKRIAKSKTNGGGQTNITYNTSNNNNIHFAFSDDGQSLSDNGRRYIGVYKGQNRPSNFDSYMWFKVLPKVIEVSQDYSLTGDEDILYLTTDRIRLMTTYTPYDGQELKIIATDTYILDGVEFKGKNYFIWYNGQWN